VDANVCAYSLKTLLYILQLLCFFWLFIGVCWALSGTERTTAHVWAVVSILVGLVTCSKLGAGTMYFFDSSAAAALLAGLALHRTSRAAVILPALLAVCTLTDVMVIIPLMTNPDLTTGYQTMLTDLRQYRRVLSDEASISIQTGRPWYWSDPFVLNELRKSGKWDPSAIDERLGSQYFDVVIVRHPTIWSSHTYEVLDREYRLWRAYPSFHGQYLVYLPAH